MKKLEYKTFFCERAKLFEYQKADASRSMPEIITPDAYDRWLSERGNEGWLFSHALNDFAVVFVREIEEQR